MALAKAKTQVDKGQSALARATLDKAAEDMAREEEERRERYVASVTALRHRERDIALAAYDGDAAADAILKLARSIHGANAAMVVEFLGKEAQALYEYGTDRGSNVHLVAAIALRRELLALASSDDERGAAHHSLGVALFTLGERESGTARLEEAVAAYSRGAAGMDARAGSARLGGDAEQSRQCAPDAWRAGERDGAAGGGGRGLSRGAGGMDARAGSARLGGDAEQSRPCAPIAWRAGERHGAARGGG